MSRETLDHWPHDVHNWGRWPNDRGTLNTLGPTAVQRGFAAVRSFDVLALGAPLRADEAGLDARAYAYEMTHAGKYRFGPADEPVQAAGDRVSIAIHGMTNSHIDALCHAGHLDRSFDGTRFEDNVAPGQPAKRFTIMDNPGIVTRAWLVDVPRARGVPALTPGDPVLPDDLGPLDGTIEPGDALVIRTGRYATRVVAANDAGARDDHGNWSGLHADCMRLIADWGVSTVATDSSGDNFPSTHPGCSVPIHIHAEVYLGLPLIHHLQLEELGSRLHARGSAAFMFIVAPLQIVGGTGSPVSPLAVL